MSEQSEDIQQLVNRVDDLVQEMTGLTNNLKSAINPEDLRRTMQQLNQTLTNASKTLAPEGGLTQTAQRTLGKLEDSIEQFRDLMTRVNKGEGSLGMLLNDPIYAEELRRAAENMNKLLNRVGQVRFIVDVGTSQLTSYSGARGWLQVGIWPKKDRYYLLGMAVDPRGRISNMRITTTAGGLSQTTDTQVIDQTGMLLTGMLGKIYFNRIDVSIGALYGDGAGSIAFRLGPIGNEDRIQIRNDLFFRTAATSFDDRLSLIVFPIQNLYLRAGIESIRGYPGSPAPVYSYGAGISFDDEDIKLLFSLR